LSSFSLYFLRFMHVFVHVTVLYSAFLFIFCFNTQLLAKYQDEMLYPKTTHIEIDIQWMSILPL